MAAAFLALQAYMDNKQKRKATAIGVFLDVETQRKFMKVASNAERDKQVHRLQTDNCHLDRMLDKSLDDCLRKQSVIGKLKDEIAEQKKEIFKLKFELEMAQAMHEYNMEMMKLGKES